MSSETSSAPSSGESIPASKPERLYKVAFDLPDETADWADASSERLWTGKTSVQMEVQVRNTPFYVKGISLGDIVRVRVDHERRELVFEEFVSEAGHSTVRVIIKDDDARSVIDAMLRSFDCSWEVDTTGYLWAIDVPPHVEYSSMRAALLRVADEGKIGIEEGALARAHRDGLGLPESDR
ncbi:DUF4265 domain-containing protein (plasmid) [Streptomyces enissocaesilis]|uniref:DUF4265 domain-containing protein n=1 Tax=Streptomyces TaxID=1883 RepID=UPI001CBBDF77|nr:DUF4265 domain-containing protein [Streptomyces sp. A144]UAX58406.1 DUF4265 domain-containing protein [Streptomyces sp. A144]WDI23395.1 DUF4265 domain-containing protein [Streptomyces enissocaesilis]